MLAEVGADGKVLAGGQSLVPLLNMRLAAPGHLVDINRLGRAGPDRTTGDDGVRVGALARHAGSSATTARMAAHSAAAPGAPATSPTRPSATGAPPWAASCTPTRPASCRRCWCCCDGAVELRLGRRQPSVSPRPTSSSGRWSRRCGRASWPSPRCSRSPPRADRHAPGSRSPGGHGDYALCGRGRGGHRSTTTGESIARARVAYISVGPTPVLVDLRRDAGRRAGIAARTGRRRWRWPGRVEPEDDIHATADYRRHLVGVLTERACRAAARSRDPVDAEAAMSAPAVEEPSHEITLAVNGVPRDGRRCRRGGCCPTACATTSA